MLPKNFKPIFVENKFLTRVGPDYDGGYILNNALIKNIETLITFGLSDEWDFEKDLLKKKPEISIYAFDHTVNNLFWINRLKKDIIHFFLLKKLRFKKILNIFKYLDYISFFDNKKRFHIQKKIGITNEDYDVNFIINNLLKDKKKILLKIDIEGDEFNILDQILKNENLLDGLLIEFHDINQNNNLSKINNFLQNLKYLKLIHIHANNYAPPDKNGDPTVIEMTFTNENLIEKFEKNNEKTYPIENLDVKNRKRLPDISIKFEM